MAGIERVITARHGGHDFTITTQQQMLDVLGSVLNVVTFAVAALGGISLLVGGVGIFTIMTIAVRERTAEIGLLRAIGAGRGQVRAIFLGESMLLAGIGGVGGLVAGAAIVALLKISVPDAAGQHLGALCRRGGGDRRPDRPRRRRAAGAAAPRLWTRSRRCARSRLWRGASPDRQDRDLRRSAQKCHCNAANAVRWGRCGPCVTVRLCIKVK